MFAFIMLVVVNFVDKPDQAFSLF